MCHLLVNINLFLLDQTFQIDFFFDKYFKPVFYFFHIIIRLLLAINSNLEHSLIKLLYFLVLLGSNILILKHLLHLIHLFIFLVIVIFIICFQTFLEKVLISLNNIHVNIKQIIIWFIFVRFTKIFVKYTTLKRYFLKIF